MKPLNRKLLQIISFSWLCFGVAGTIIFFLLAIPQITVAIERSYCPPERWLRVKQSYAQLYQQDRQGRISIKQVILFNDLGEEILNPIPSPEVIESVNTYGRSSIKAQELLKFSDSKLEVLTCTSP